jgi:hypothetical protein
MLWLFKAGGFSMWFIALFGLISLVASALFVRRPNERRLEFIRFMSKATVYSAVAGVFSCLAAVFVHVPGNPEWAKSPDIHLIVMEGLGESMAPGILGFGLLSLVAFLTALGVRRLPRDA